MEVEFSYICCTECKRWGRLATILSYTVLDEKEHRSANNHTLFAQNNTQQYCAECSTLLDTSKALTIPEHAVSELLDRDGNLQKVKAKKVLGYSIAELKLLNTLTQQLREESIRIAIIKRDLPE